MSDGLTVSVPPELVEALARRTAELVAGVVDTAAGRREQVARASNGRVALSRAEAADALGISVDHLDRHVLPELRTVRTGRLRLIPVSELVVWVDRNAARALKGGR